MIDGATIVLDVGKTHAKLSLWDEHGGLVERCVRANDPSFAPPFQSLDVAGIDAWLIESLAACARLQRVKRIIPVAHGAAAAVIRNGRLHADPMDYEQPVAEDERRAYAAQRDAFSVTGSPFLPHALNLGMQLHLLESLNGPLPADATILPWPQYWAWRLSGVAASEVTSLGCHSDLWRPAERRFTELAHRRGWAERMARLRHAGETLGSITAEVADATGLPRDCEVLCGLHDSNAALLASRGYGRIADHDVTVLSTGTWFVAMRSLRSPADFDAGTLEEHRDCLINVDVHGSPIPSARFMGGREAEIILSRDSGAPSEALSFDSLAVRLPDLLARNIGAYPSLVPGVGPFPDSPGRLSRIGHDMRDRHVVASLYLAMMTDTMLDLIGSQGKLLVEGRFANDELFVRVLAQLRPQQSVLTGRAADDLAFGARRLVSPTLEASAELSSVEPLEIDLTDFADDWRRQAGECSPKRRSRAGGETARS